MRAHFCSTAYQPSHYSRFVLLLVMSAAMLLAAGCGSNQSVTKTTFSGNTRVIVLASSTANDQLSQLTLTLQSLTLTSQSGQTVSLLATPASDEFMHLNGHVEPVATVSVPQGIYSSAAASISGAYPACAGQSIVDEALGSVNGPTPASIASAQPITVTGTAMGLVLDLQVSQTAPFNGGCSGSLTNSVTITPTFKVTPIAISAQPTNSENGKIFGVEGLISSVNADGSGFTAGALYSMNGLAQVPKWQVSVNSSTVFEGVANGAGLAAGMPVDMDFVIRPDGSLLATRVAVYDTNTTNLSVAYGPPLSIYPSGGYQAVYPVMDTLEVEQAGNLPSLSGLYGGLLDTTSEISGQFTNLLSLPFVATFNSGNMVDGQNVLFTTHASTPFPGESVTTLTLLPQTINGTVSAISNEGNFSTYTVTLAPYDLFPNLAVQPGQTTLLTNPSTVVVYVDSNTQTLNSGTVSVGGLFRFYGLIFNDNGTLRMDCAQVNDGVAE
jgi:uncharacterized protein (UPF0333 family)